MSLIGKTTQNNSVLSFPPSLHDENYKKSAVPHIGTCGTTHTVDIEYSLTDNGIIEDYILEFDVATNDATNYLVLNNPYLLLAEIKYLISNVEVTHLSTTEQISSAFDTTVKTYYNKGDFFSLFQKFRLSLNDNYSSVGITSSKSISLPLTLLFPELRKHNTSHGIFRPSFQFRFQPNYNTTPLNNRFCQSGTTTNAWDTTKISISNIAVRPIITRYSDKSIPRNVVNPVFILHKFEVKEYSQSWNTPGTDKLKIDLTDFPRHKKILDLRLRIFPEGLNTTYNDVDAMKAGYNNSLNVGYEVRYQSRVMIDFTTVATQNKRVIYQNEVFNKRFNKMMPTELENDSTDLNKYFLDSGIIDLSHSEAYDADQEHVGGVSNLNNDYEFTFYCTNALATSCKLFVIMHYVEAMTVKNGIPQISR